MDRAAVPEGIWGGGGRVDMAGRLETAGVWLRQGETLPVSPSHGGQVCPSTAPCWSHGLQPSPGLGVTGLGSSQGWQCWESLVPRRAGKSYKFNKIHLINYSSSPGAQFTVLSRQKSGKAGQPLLEFIILRSRLQRSLGSQHCLLQDSSGGGL